MAEMVYLNGSLMPRSEAKLSPFDHGFLYGYGLFETMRAYSGHIFHLDRHLARLSRSAEIIGLKSRLASFDLKQACIDTLQANGLTEARLRLAVSGGEGEIIPDPSTCQGHTVFIVAGSYTPRHTQIYQEGFKAVVSSLRRNSQSPLSRIKSASYLESILARMEAKAAGVDEALFLNDRGFLVEASTSNVFLVNAGMLFTPPEESGILPGITREAVMELAQSSGIEVTEHEVTLEQLLEAEESFLTNSILEIMPLTWVNGKPLGSGKPGVVTRRLMAAYKELVKTAIEAPPR